MKFKTTVTNVLIVFYFVFLNTENTNYKSVKITGNYYVASFERVGCCKKLNGRLLSESKHLCLAKLLFASVDVIGENSKRFF